MSFEAEKQEIEKTIQCFFDGIDSLDESLVKKAFYANKTEFLSVKSSEEPVAEGNLEQFLTTLQAVKNDPKSIFNTEKCEKTILYIDISGSAASAKIRLKFSTFAYTDYYNLLKIKGDWKIVNKTFDTEVF